MCQFFSALVTRDHRVLFCEDNSHETLIARAGLSDTQLHLRHWVRVEVRPDGDGWGAVHVDEITTPAWYDQVEDGDRVIAVAERVRPAWAAYEANLAQANAAYDAARAPARAAYEATCATAEATYYANRAQANAAYDAAHAQAWATHILAISSLEGYLHSG